MNGHAAREYRDWLNDVQTCIRVKTGSALYCIEESADYPLYEMYSEHDMSAPDAADDIINKVQWD